MASGQANQTARRRSARAMTLLEVVLAIAVLGLLATSATTTMGFLYGSQVREQRRLGAAELASRLVLMYLDNPTAMPGKSDTIPYANDLYRYEIDESDITLNPAPHVGDALANRRGQSPFTIDRLEQITVRVWLSEESGGLRDFDTDVPNAVLVRVFDPQFFNRNPDSGFKAFDDLERRDIIIQQIFESSR